MAKKSAAKPRKRWNLKPALAAFAALALAAAVYLIVVGIGHRAGEAVVDHPRYQIKFEEIQCPAPPGLDRATFLAEVRYVAEPLAEMSTTDSKIPARLAEAFAKHPWVASAAPAAWPQPVTLVFRTPALAIATKDGERVVDTFGVLLPASASPAGLPKLLTPQPLPNMSAGEVWKSRDVLRAIDVAKDYSATALERTPDGWRLKQKNGTTLTVVR